MKPTHLLLLTALLLFACKRDQNNIDYRDEMRKFVVEIAHTARQTNKNFVVIPQNGIEIVTRTDEPNGALANDYLAAIDGHGQESLFYGYNRDDQATPANESAHLIAYLERSQAVGNTILVTDYCSTPAKVVDSYAKNSAKNFVSMAADSRELDKIPAEKIHNENAENITRLADAKNFLYLINPKKFASKADFIAAVCATNYDLLIADLFFEGEPLTNDEVLQLRRKANGGTRLLVAYMSIGEAEDYRYYWQTSWKRNKPSWLAAENPQWKGNYKVRYWDKEWQNIIIHNTDSYLNRILAAGFDGVYLDIIDAFEYFE